ncbi:MAG TPA: EAL domain-containing protein [Bryobacteraceae bacterium]|nr:EAL domain-containing protein [Bryobacteraceae bacterium]
MGIERPALRSVPVLVFTILTLLPARAASPWRFWTKSDGLKESVAFGLTSDSDGRIIVKAGDVSVLSILDGYQISEIPSPHAYGRVLPSPDHKLWTFDAKGIDVYDNGGWHAYPDNEIVRFATDSSMLGIPWFTYSVFHGPENRMDIAPLANDSAILMFPDKLLKWDHELGRRTTIRLAAQTGLKRFRDIQDGKEGRIWVTGETGVGRLQYAGAAFDWIELPGAPGYRDFAYPSEGQGGELFVSSTRLDGKRVVLRLFDGKWQEVYATAISATRLKGWRGPGGNIWIQRDRKIIQCDATGHPIEPNDGKSITGLTTAVLSSSDETFWLATTAGVARYSLPLWRTPSDLSSVDEAVSAITEDAQHRVWFVAGGLLLSEDQGQWKRYQIPKGTGEPVLTDNIVPLDNGDIAIIANSISNLVIFHPRTGKFQIVPNGAGKRIGGIAKRREGGLWIQTLQRDGARWTLDIFENGEFRDGGLPDMKGVKDLKAMLETRTGDIWLATTRGAGRISGGPLRPGQLRPGQLRLGQLRMFGPGDGFTDTGVFSLVETPDGRVLLGGRDNVTVFDGRSFRKLHEIDLAESICIDANGVIWAASGSGLHRFKPGQWLSNSVEEGLAATAVRKVFADSHGRIWAGTGQGISLYHPLADSDPPITRIIEDRNFRETPPGGRVRVTFSGTDKWKVTPSDRLLFSWRVDDSEWSDFASPEFASFEGLKGGHHRFEARAMDRNGNIDPRPAAYEFRVLMPWYQQTSFLLLAALAVFIILALARMVWRHHASLKYQSVHDPLTGLVNRTVFEKRFQEAINLARATSSLVAVILLDLDRFKPINDTLGHAVGDLFLREVSRRLGRTVRRHDTLARLGGDEFAIVMPQLRTREEAELAAQKLLEVLRAPYQIESFELSGSASIGVSLFPEHGNDTATLQRLADMAMYQCKARSKDEYVIFDAECAGVDFHAAHIVALIKESLEQQYFQLHYQPLKNIDQKLIGFEALIRLDHPRLGVLPPDDFIGIAEHTGLIVRVGHWVLREACRQTAQWHRAGYPDLRINVNVSTVQLMKSDYVDSVISVLAETGLNPSTLTLEITETQMMRNIRDSLSQISRLRKLGVTIALDDFGTGYSTLGSLGSVEIDYIKIDRCFVSRMNNPEHHGIAVIDAIATLAHKFGLTIVAEGVETSEQLEALVYVGCDLLQGFFLGRPSNATEAEALLFSEPGLPALIERAAGEKSLTAGSHARG